MCFYSLFFRSRSFPPWWQLAFPLFLTTGVKFQFFFQRNWSPLVFISRSTILDKTVEKIVYLGNIFLNIVAVPFLPSPPSPESNVVLYSKESLFPGRLQEATLNWGKGISFRKGVVLEIVLLPPQESGHDGEHFLKQFCLRLQLFLCYPRQCRH